MATLAQRDSPDGRVPVLADNVVDFDGVKSRRRRETSLLLCEACARPSRSIYGKVWLEELIPTVIWVPSHPVAVIYPGGMACVAAVRAWVWHVSVFKR